MIGQKSVMVPLDNRPFEGGKHNSQAGTADLFTAARYFSDCLAMMTASEILPVEGAIMNQV